MLKDQREGLTLDAARALHQRRGYKLYTGPKLQGPRCVLRCGDAGFPSALASIPEPPGLLYVIGNAEALQEGLAIIGARKATPYGLGCARRFGRMAAARGITIISGGARGCDSEAHRAALHEGSPTVAFLGGGCDQPYPQRNFKLFQQIIDGGGAVVSERDWDFPPLPYTFRARNRLIAGLAKATLIVEAGLPSGTFSTADEALAANRDVLVVPGAITSKTSAGSNRLLYQGATPVADDESFEDALSRVFGLLKQESYCEHGSDALSHDAPDDVLYNALAAEPMRMDEIVSKVGPLVRNEPDPMAYLQMRVAQLEAQGAIGRYPDGRFGPLNV